MQHRQLDLSLEDIGLCSLSGSELRVRNLDELSEQFNLFMMNLYRFVRKKQVVVSLLETGDQLPFFPMQRLFGHLGRPTRDFAFQGQLAREWKILRETEDAVVCPRDVEGLREIPQVHGEDGVVQ